MFMVLAALRAPTVCGGMSTRGHRPSSGRRCEFDRRSGFLLSSSHLARSRHGRSAHLERRELRTETGKLKIFCGSRIRAVISPSAN